MTSIRRRSPWRVVVAKQTAESVVCPTRKQAVVAEEQLTSEGTQDVKVERAPNGSWEARIRCKLTPDLVKTFKLKTEADLWVCEREGEIAKRQYMDYRAHRGTSSKSAKWAFTRATERDVDLGTGISRIAL